MILRPYQDEGIKALLSFWRKGGGNGLVVVPTGGGKSLMLAELCRILLAGYPSLRVAIVTHVRELIAQNYSEMMQLWPQAPAGIFSAGIGRRDMRAQILHCGIQTVYDKVQLIGAVDLVLVDEAHLVGKNAGTMYGKFFMDSGRLDRGPGRLFDKIVYEAKVTDLIDQGYLSPLISKATVVALDTKGVGKRGGEFIAGELEVAVDKDWITRAAAEEMAKFGKDRKSWLAFCVGIKHCEHIRDAVRGNGFSCEMITSVTPKGERDQIIRQFRQGRIHCLTSVGVLGTGFNVPQVDMIALLRPTQSPGLFVQQVGRGLRKAKGKKNCLVLDFAGNTKAHGPIDMVTANSVTEAKEREPGEALAKECPKCGSLIALGALTCPDCGHVFPPRSEVPKHEAIADGTTTILSKGAPVWIDVDRVLYYRHDKMGSQPSLRVEYHCGFIVHKFWACFDHIGIARNKAEVWWKRLASTTVPRSTEEALSRTKELQQPIKIQVRPDGKYFAVVGFQLQERETV
jgi:DNA repair protein RadD